MIVDGIPHHSFIALNALTTIGSVFAYATPRPTRKKPLPATSIDIRTTFSRFVSAGKIKRRMAYIMKGNASAVPPQPAIEIIVETPVVRSSPCRSSSLSPAGLFSHSSIHGVQHPATTAQIAQATAPKTSMSRSASRCSRSGRGGSFLASGSFRREIAITHPPLAACPQQADRRERKRRHRHSRPPARRSSQSLR